jgi:hypothetical protein
MHTANQLAHENWFFDLIQGYILEEKNMVGMFLELRESELSSILQVL